MFLGTRLFRGQSSASSSEITRRRWIAYQESAEQGATDSAVEVGDGGLVNEGFTGWTPLSWVRVMVL